MHIDLQEKWLKMLTQQKNGLFATKCVDGIAWAESDFKNGNLTLFQDIAIELKEKVLEGIAPTFWGVGVSQHFF